MAEYLKSIRHHNEEKFLDHLVSLPIKIRAKILIELPIAFQADKLLFAS